ncbi:MAG: Rieske 2Fe-2S domain-containing protein [Methanomassiliicoccales archaeon]|nr:Rieske 2Fe-2S domain-containing protein [Methanomassiliicoccales archaeon]
MSQYLVATRIYPSLGRIIRSEEKDPDVEDQRWKAIRASTWYNERSDLDDRYALVTNLNGSFHATGERCSHIGGDLAKGKLVGLTVIFPVHGSGLHLRTGRVAKNVRIQFIGRTADPEVFKVGAEGEDAFV